SIRMQESRYEDVRVRPIELLVAKVAPCRRDAEPPTLFCVKYRRKYARGIKMRQTQPVDRPIHAHQSRRAHVADNSVALDRLIRCRHETKPPLSRHWP